MVRRFTTQYVGYFIALTMFKLTFYLLEYVVCSEDMSLVVQLISDHTFPVVARALNQNVRMTACSFLQL